LDQRQRQAEKGILQMNFRFARFVGQSLAMGVLLWGATGCVAPNLPPADLPPPPRVTPAGASAALAVTPTVPWIDFAITPTPVSTPAPLIAPPAAEALSPVVQRALQRELGAAPELISDTWLNSSPLQLADLRGKVVLVEFWTFDCYNCRNVLPALQTWQARYADEGLVIIGVHTPEFRYEYEIDNVKAAVANLGVTLPVAIDNEKVNWRAYENHYWPAMYLIDKAGQIRYIKIGEGQYETTAEVIEALLKGS
jgi:thiol-disulfide isomerase/thioredoxin